MLPAARHFDQALVLESETMRKFTEAALPNTTIEQRRDPSISPFYVNLKALAAASPHETMPPALFTCGTSDPLLEDSVMMSTRWMMSGAKAILRIYPGAPHGFTLFSRDKSDATEEGFQNTKTFLIDHL